MLFYDVMVIEWFEVIEFVGESRDQTFLGEVQFLNLTVSNVFELIVEFKEENCLSLC